MSIDSDQVQCEVTGNWVPADEVITFQGKQVGAEGKAILLGRLRSGEGEPGGMVAPTIGKRFKGLFVDWIITGSITFVITVVIFVNFFSPPRNNPIEAQITESLIQAMLYLVMSVIILIYFAWFHIGRGQTPGKRSARIKVVMLDGSSISRRVSYLRSLYFYFPAFVSSVVGLALTFYMADLRRSGEIWIDDGSKAKLVISVLLAVATANWIYFVVDVILALIDRSSQRSLHDRLAGTRVIRVS